MYVTPHRSYCFRYLQIIWYNSHVSTGSVANLLLFIRCYYNFVTAFDWSFAFCLKTIQNYGWTFVRIQCGLFFDYSRLEMSVTAGSYISSDSETIIGKFVKSQMKQNSRQSLMKKTEPIRYYAFISFFFFCCWNDLLNSINRNWDYTFVWQSKSMKSMKLINVNYLWIFEYIIMCRT